MDLLGEFYAALLRLTEIKGFREYLAAGVLLFLCAVSLVMRRRRSSRGSGGGDSGSWDDSGDGGGDGGGD